MIDAVRRVESYSWKDIRNQKLLVVQVDPPVDLAAYRPIPGLVAKLYLTNRFVEQASDFQNLEAFPLFVHVLVAKSDGVEELESIEDLSHIAWADLYDNRQDAETDQKSFS
ncbi:MAG: hypothetical protein WBD22_06260 [Pyrinomonadaceae bacterium]